LEPETEPDKTKPQMHIPESPEPLPYRVYRYRLGFADGTTQFHEGVIPPEVMEQNLGGMFLESVSPCGARRFRRLMAFSVLPSSYGAPVYMATAG
jgi:hypothetical protein